LTDRNVWNIMPFDNDIVIGTFKGRDLPKVVTKGRHVDPDRDYTLAASDYTAANQETNENFQTGGLVFTRNLGPMRQMLLDWFRQKKVIDGAE